MSSHLVVNVDELWLKGKNRGMYFTSLRNHLNNKAQKLLGGKAHIHKLNQRFILSAPGEISEECIKELTYIPGIFDIWAAEKVELDLDQITECAVKLAQSFETPCTFKVETKRSNKQFPQNSMEVSRHVGHHVLKNTPDLKVDVKNPQTLLNIYILDKEVYLAAKQYPAFGGLPVGTSGHSLTLISGGFDSPVASAMMAKRGCSQDFVFFYAYPYVGDEVKEKIIKLCSHLGKFQSKCRLFVVPFGEVQKRIADTCDPAYRTMLFRKMMVKLSNMLALELEAQALITGDSLGQVSSQTMGNISLMDRTSDIPIFRPLIGLNKAEIIAISREVGTHDISLIPHDDACSLFAPKKPIIRPNLKYWEDFANKHDFSDLFKDALSDTEKFTIDELGQYQELT